MKPTIVHTWLILLSLETGIPCDSRGSHNGLGFTRTATAGKSIRYKTNYKARVAAADQPRKRRREEGFVGRPEPSKSLSRNLQACERLMPLGDCVFFGCLC